MLASRAAARVALRWVRAAFWAALTRPPKFPVSGGDKTVADLFSAPQTHFCATLVRPGLTVAALVKGQLRASPVLWLPG